MPKERAKEEWRLYCDLLKKRKEKYLEVMKSAYYHMKEGRELIDVYEIIKKFGVTKNNEPKIVVARADGTKLYFEKRDEGSGVLGINMQYTQVYGKDCIYLPQKTFEIHWERRDDRSDSDWNIKNKIIQTKVPLIPAQLIPDGSLENYYILWESKDWEDLPPAKDPLLLKRISENMFAILGAWDVTELERSIMRGIK